MRATSLTSPYGSVIAPGVLFGTDRARQTSQQNGQEAIFSAVLQYVLGFARPDRQDMQGLGGTIILALARPWPSEMKITKRGPADDLRGGAGRGYGEGLRSAIS